MDISQETPEETDARLRRVLATASLDLDERSWWYEELALVEFPRQVRDDAVAIVRDADRWSQLIPVGPADAPPERFRLWTFHFPVDLDNSGFVGWLATHIKRATGSGVFVVWRSEQRAYLRPLGLPGVGRGPGAGDGPRSGRARQGHRGPNGPERLAPRAQVARRLERRGGRRRHRDDACL